MQVLERHYGAGIECRGLNVDRIALEGTIWPIVGTALESGRCRAKVEGPSDVGSK